MALSDFKPNVLLKDAIGKGTILVKDVDNSIKCTIKSTVDKSKDTIDKGGTLIKEATEKRKDMKQVSMIQGKIKELDNLINEKKILIGDYYHAKHKEFGSLDNETLEFFCKMIDEANREIEELEEEKQEVKGTPVETKSITNAFSNQALVATPEVAKLVEDMLKEKGYISEMGSSAKDELINDVLKELQSLRKTP
ncbi:MAG: hypothetical protein FWC91_10545 [Defluviitaleaceae bacterium]|nr:hypothetical protein [Defluviitaleaceae bacterium]